MNSATLLLPSQQTSRLKLIEGSNSPWQVIGQPSGSIRAWKPAIIAVDQPLGTLRAQSSHPVG